MSTRECTDVGEDYREGKRERASREDESWPGAAGSWAGQTGCAGRGGVRGWTGGVAQEDREDGSPEGAPQMGLGAGAVWQAGWGSGGRRAAQGPRRKRVRPAAAWGSGDWSRRPREAEGEVDPAPGRLHAEVAGLASPRAEQQDREGAEARSGHRSGPGVLFPELGTCGAREQAGLGC